MSMWISLVLVGMSNSVQAPVSMSVKCVPTPITTSALPRPVVALAACRPGRCNRATGGGPQGRPPCRTGVAATGMPVVSANSSSASHAPELAMPLPTTTTGRSALLISSIASRDALRVRRRRAVHHVRGRVGQIVVEISVFWMSNGIAMTTGPGRPECAVW